MLATIDAKPSDYKRCSYYWPQKCKHYWPQKIQNYWSQKMQNLWLQKMHTIFLLSTKMQTLLTINDAKTTGHRICKNGWPQKCKHDAVITFVNNLTNFLDLLQAQNATAQLELVFKVWPAFLVILVLPFCYRPFLLQFYNTFHKYMYQNWPHRDTDCSALYFLCFWFAKFLFQNFNNCNRLLE